MAFDSQDELKKKLAEQFQASQTQNDIVEGLTGLPQKAASLAGKVISGRPEEQALPSAPQNQMYDTVSDQDLGNALFGMAQSGKMNDFQQANPDFKGLREKEMSTNDPQQKMKFRQAILQRLSQFGK